VIAYRLLIVGAVALLCIIACINPAGALSKNGGQIFDVTYAQDGSSAAPSYSFADQAGSGIYRDTNGFVNISSFGVRVFGCNAGGVYPLSQVRAITGSVGAPVYSFAAALTSGFYRPAANTIGVAAGGVQVATITTTTIALKSTGTFLRKPIIVVIGSDTLTTVQSGATITNTGDADGSTPFLPAVSGNAGVHYTFYRIATQSVQVSPQVGEQLNIWNLAPAAGEGIILDDDLESVTFVCDGAEWYATVVVGTPVEENP